MVTGQLYWNPWIVTSTAARSARGSTGSGMADARADVTALATVVTPRGSVAVAVVAAAVAVVAVDSVVLVVAVVRVGLAVTIGGVVGTGTASAAVEGALVVAGAADACVVSVGIAVGRGAAVAGVSRHVADPHLLHVCGVNSHRVHSAAHLGIAIKQATHVCSGDVDAALVAGAEVEGDCVARAPVGRLLVVTTVGTGDLVV